MRPTFPPTAAWLTAVLVLGSSLGAVLLQGPPAPVQATAPPTVFSAERAMADVRWIAERPHPTGSADHDRVRDRLVAALQGLGLPVERQRTTVVVPRLSRGARVENVMARLPGTASTGAVLLAAHYDSVPAGPGAADDGSGVAALLGTVRALTAGPPLRNDLVVLITDAEELGMLGARAFVEQHPWARDVRVAVNLEARGTCGPSQMFETGPGNGAVVRAWASRVPRPTGSSLTYEVYRRMPNDTDFSVFRSLPITGLNFAFIGGWERYHTARDTPAALDRGSLQHQGAAALALARAFGNADLGHLQAPDAVYFTIPIIGVVARYPAAWATPLAGLAALALLLALLLANRRRTLRVTGVLAAAGFEVGFIAAAALLAFFVARLAAAVHGRILPPGDVIRSGPYAAAVAVLVVTAWLIAYALLRRHFAATTMVLGAALVLVAGALASARLLPGGSYLFAWPALGAALAAALLSWSKGRRDTARAVAAWALGLPAVLLLWPLVPSLFTAMGLAPPSAAVLAAVAALALVALAPATEVIAEGRRAWPAAVAGLATLSLLGWGAASTRYSPAHPRHVNLTYALDADSGRAEWSAWSQGGAVPWLAQYLGDAPSPARSATLVPPWSTAAPARGWLTSPAPPSELSAPTASLVHEEPSSAGRSVTLRVTPAAAGHALSLWATGARVVRATVEARPANASGRGEPRWTFLFANAPADGITVTLELAGPSPLHVAVLDRSSGLPVIPGRSFTPRPADVVPVQDGDQTGVHRVFTF